MPEYYLTDCEHEIFSNQKEEISQAICPEKKLFNLVELGSGDGLKTKILLKHLVEEGIHFQYTPVDISAKANHELLPDLQVEAQTGDYLKAEESEGRCFHAKNHPFSGVEHREFFC